ncbi:hypothetical protein [Paenibacillus motobuensis]|uniref:Uncharacterized protein n=1 Tax=Paenibacillus motobuensis TaxID=295324 RepID=A0ABP3HTN3_9BACL
MILTTGLVKIVSSTIVLGLISTFFKLGIWSQIATSEFLEQHDNKNDLLREAKKDIYQFSDNVFSGILRTIPLLVWFVVLYLASQVYSDKLIDLPFFTTPSISIYIYPPVLFILFQAGYLFFGFDVSRVHKNPNGRIKYNHPAWYTYFILIIVLFLVFIERTIDPTIKNKLLNILQVNDDIYLKKSLVFLVIAWFSYFIILKPLSRYLALLEHSIFMERLKNVKNDSSSVFSICTLFFTILIFMFGIFLVLSGKVNIIQIPYGDLINLFCFILLGAVLTGQRTKFLEITRSYKYINGKYYFINSKGKKISIKK